MKKSVSFKPLMSSILYRVLTSMHKHKRLFDHLTRYGLKQEDIDSYIQAVEDLFYKEYLNSDSAKGVLPILWKRLDFIATNELVTLGQAICNLKAQNNPEIDDWLFSAAKEVKKQAKRSGQSDGFLREILYCGSMFDSVGKIIPAKKAQQAYDLEIKGGPVDFIISLKKFGKSDNQKTFEGFCNRLAIAIREKSAHFKKNVKVGISLTTTLDEALFERLKQCIADSVEFDNMEYTENGVLVMKSGPLVYVDLKPDSASWQLNVFAPESKNEQSRFLKQIIKEISNIKKTLDSSPDQQNALRVLSVNVNESCDMDLLQEKLSHHYKPFNHEDIGVDLVFVQKSAVCQERGSITLKDLVKGIYHDFRPINFENNISPRMQAYFKVASTTKSPLKMKSLIGRFTTIPRPAMQLNENEATDIVGCYAFQKGLYRFDMKKELNSYYADLIVVTPKGIQCEIILPKELDKRSGDSMIIQSKITAPHDDLLII